MWLDGEAFCEETACYKRNFLMVHRMRPQDMEPHEDNSDDLSTDAELILSIYPLESALESRVGGRQRRAPRTEVDEEDPQLVHYGSSQAARDLRQNVWEKERVQHELLLAFAESRRGRCGLGSSQRVCFPEQTAEIGTVVETRNSRSITPYLACRKLWSV